ncbi:lectin domain protein [Stenotrophomonas phage Marzo]|nr:lectin domain protein [Stenotrophomonas phage Marzo]
MAYLEGTCTTGGVATAGVKVYAFRTGQWGAPAVGTSDFEGKWRVEGLIDDVPYDVAFVHPEGEWEGKMSSRRMPIFDPFADPYWEDTTLLIHFDDIGGQQPINERGIPNLAIRGTGALIADAAPTPKFGTGCLNINNGATSAGYWFGSSNGTVAAGNPFYLAGTENFTVEGWFFCRSGVATNTYRDICILGANDKGVVINGSSQIVYYDGGIKIQGPAMTALYDKWVWLVVQRENGVTSMWLDGQKIGFYADAEIKNCFRLGSNVSNSEQFYGGLDEWRHTRAARYPGSPVSITVPTAPFNTGNPIRSDNFSVNRLWNYLQDTAAGTATWSINAGRLETNISSGASRYIRRDFASANMYVEGEFYTAQDCGLIWRYVDLNNFYQLTISDDQALANAKPNTVRIYKWVGGAASQVGADMPATITRGSANKIRVTMTGNTIDISVNGTSVGSVTDSSIAIKGQFGLFAAAGSGYDGMISVDNLKWDTVL